MNSLLRALALGLLVNAGSEANENTTTRITGVVVFEGAVPRQTIADDSGRYRPRFHVDSATGGVENAVVSLTPLAEKQFPDEDGATLEPAVIEQIDFHFDPQVTAVLRGQPVVFGNGDAANHNVRTAAKSPRNEMNIVTPPRDYFQKRFDPEPAGTAIPLTCDIHAWMAGWIYVFAFPYFDATDENGRFAIDNVPPGRYQLTIEQPAGNLSLKRKLDLEADETLQLQCAFVKTKDEIRGQLEIVTTEQRPINSP